MPKKGVIPPQFLKHPPPSWRKSRKRKGGRRKRRRRRSNPIPRRRRGGGKLLGTVGWKGILFGTAILTLAKYLAKRFAPLPANYVTPVAMVGASFVPIGGTKGLRSAGIMDGASEFISDFFLGGAPALGRGRYDV